MTASFEMDAAAGGRLSEFKVGGYQIIFNDKTEDPLAWGAYPMVPFAGRVENGRFNFGDRSYQLPINLGEHSIHGNAFTSNWNAASPEELQLELDGRWPLGGSVVHGGSLTRPDECGRDGSGRLELALTVTATTHSMPAMVGWHPWFNRRLTPEGPSAQVVVPNFQDAEMYEVGSDMIPTGRLVSPPDPGPWDHPFRKMEQPIEISWPGQLKLELSSTCDHWVIYDHLEHALCVEPQSGPPNVFNPERFDVRPDVLQPGETLSHTFGIEWELLQ